MRISSKRTLLAGALAATLAVIDAQAGLTHRYSFTANGNDSIGGANATLLNGASITAMNSAAGNGVWFQNTSNNTTTLYKSGDGVNGQYVTLPTNVLAGAKNLTIEFWSELSDAISPSAGTWSRVYDFGDPYSAPGSGRNFIMFTPHSGLTPNDSHVEFNLNQTGVTTGSYATLEPYHHVVNVFDCANGFIEVYIDGAKVGHAATTYQITNLVTKAMWLGRSEYTADDYLYGYLNEFRIYDRALSAPEILADSQVGADVINPDLTAQLGAVSAIAISDPGTVLERYTTNVAVTADFANAPGLTLFNTPGFTLTSSAPTVATVDGGGVIKALKPGTTIITATYSGKTTTLSLTVSPDTIAPVITGADTGGYDRLLNLTFSKALDPISALNAANYVLDAGAITVASVTLLTNNADHPIVRLITSPFNPNAEHSAVVNNLKDLDLAPNTIAANSTIKFGLAAGAPLIYRLYFTTAGYKSDTLANGKTNPGYPYTGGTTYLLPNGLTDAGGRGDNYFSVINGWFVPPTTGQYTFGVATDDESTFYVSTDDTAAHLPTVATMDCTGYATAKGYVSGGTPPVRTGNPTVSFQAGNKYYFRLVHRNGTGGDNLDVTWQMPGAPAIANNDPAIPAQYMIPEIETNVTLAITTQPTNQTVLQARPVTLSMGVVGVPTYTGIQWYKNGAPISGANGVSLSFANAVATNAGTYYAVVSNLVYSVQSSNAVLTVTADLVKPTLVSASTRLGNNVDIKFSEQVDPATATNKANYVVKNGTVTETITSLSLDSTGTIVSLAVTPKIVGAFTVVVSNVKDLANNVIIANSGANGVVLGVTPGMIAYWPLDTVVGTKTPDVVSGYDMTLVNVTSNDFVTGHAGLAVKFVSARSTIIKRVHSATDSLPAGKNPQFSISVWVNGPPNQSDRVPFSESSSKSTQPMLDLRDNASDKLDILNRTDAGSSPINHVKSLATVYDNTWHHVVWLQSSNGATVQIYIDGVKDGQTWGGAAYPCTMDTTAFGGVQRATAGSYFDGMVDDVAIWNRLLDPEEIAELYAHGTPIPPPIVQPLIINSFKADLSAVAVGDQVTLRWDLSKDADKVEIQPGIGDVTATTIAGSGTALVTLQNSVTYTLTVHRGVESLSQQVTVSAIGDVTPGWALLDNFDRYDVGPLPNPWVAATGPTIVDVDGNRMLSVALSGGDICALPLQLLSVPQGQQTTLFARLYLPTDIPAAGIDELMGLSDKGTRNVGDDLGDLGPGIRIQNPSGAMQIGTENGYGTPLEWATMPLASKTAYNLWIDIENDPIATGDLMTIYVAQDGDENRTTLFQNYHSNRNPVDNTLLGPTSSNLVNLIVGGNTASSYVYFDDFYISKSGYNSTVPHAFGFTPPVIAATTPPKLSGVISGNNVVISYSKDQAAGYTLQSAASVNGAWATVSTPAVDSGTNSTVTVPASKNVEFFRLMK